MRAASYLIRGLSIVVMAASSVSAPLAADDESRPIRLGETVSAEMPFGDPYVTHRLFELTLSEASPLTIECRSLEFNTAFVLTKITTDGDHSEMGVGEDGVGTNGRLTLETAEAGRYLIRVRPETFPFCGGRFEIEVSGAIPEPLDQAAWVERDEAYWEAVRSLARESGRPECEIRALKGLGILRGLTGARAEAKDLLREALEKAEQALGPEHLYVAECAFELGRHERDLGEFADSKPLLERALAIREGHLGSEHLDVAQNLDDLAMQLWQMGDLAGARELAQRSLAVREEKLGPDHPDVAQSLNSIGALNYTAGRLEEARPFYERALAILERQHGPEYGPIAVPVSNLAVLYQDLGLWEEARALHQRALRISEREKGPDHPEYATFLGKMARFFRATGEYGKAKPLYDRALEIFEEKLGPEHPLVATYLNNLGVLLMYMGSYADAEPLLQRCLAIREEKQVRGGYELAWPLIHLAQIHRRLGSYDDSRKQAERALGIMETQFGPESIHVNLALGPLALTLRQMGRLDEARALNERAVAIAEKAAGPDDPSFARSLNGLARFHANAGSLDKAKTLHERAAAIYEQSYGPDHPTVAMELNSLARVDAALGNEEAAFATALRAERIGSDHLRVTTRSLPQRMALTYASVRSSGIDLALSLAVAGLDDPAMATRRVWDAVIRSRALVLDEMAERNRIIAGSEDPEIARLSDAVVSASTRLANAAVRGQRRMSAAEYREVLESAREEKEKAEQSLAMRSAAFKRILAREGMSLSDVSRSLAPGDAVLAFVLYERTELIGSGKAPPSIPEDDRCAGSPDPHRPRPSYLAFVLPSTVTDPKLVPLGAADEIDALIENWQAEAGRGVLKERNAPDGSEERYRRSASAVREAVWDPVAPYLREAKRLFIVPDGALNLLSFSSLPVGRAEYLVERGPRVHYLSAERDLIDHGGASRSGRHLLAMGGPDFNERLDHQHPVPTQRTASLAVSGAEPAGVSRQGESEVSTADSEAHGDLGAHPREVFRGERSQCDGFQSVNFDSIPGSSKEVDDVVSLWRRSVVSAGSRIEPRAGAGSTRSSSGPLASVAEFTGPAATESVFKSLAPSSTVLHLATHGFFLGGPCGSTFDSTRGVGSFVEREETEPSPRDVENPLLLSGLAFAGANLRAEAHEGEEDGILTAEEVAAMDLSGVQWAVLSACDTGTGEVRAGEGVFGLRRSFQIAGVETLIMSLWEVEDEAARAWMLKLYEGLLSQGLEKADAVHKASLETLRERRAGGQTTHPFYWAGFVASGNWR